MGYHLRLQIIRNGDFTKNSKFFVFGIHKRLHIVCLDSNARQEKKHKDIITMISNFGLYLHLL